MNQEKPNPAAKEQVPPDQPRRPRDFDTRPDLDGKTDSGPEPDVHGRDLPPQK